MTIEEIRADIVATVLDVSTTAGQCLSVGDTVLVLESMKMEIPVIVERECTLVSLCVEAGDVVQDGDVVALVR